MKDKIYHILVIDDDKEIHDLIAETLRPEGYKINCISDPSSIEEILEMQITDIVISDIRMPNMNGLQLLKLVKEFDANLPVIMITGYADFKSMKKAIKYGAFDFLKKPFHLSELLITVKQALEKRELLLSNKRYKEKLEEMVIDRTKKLLLANRKLENNIIKSILAMVNALEASDEYTKGHSERVASLSLLLGDKLKISEENKEALMLGAILHDVGKIGIYDRILNKPAELNSKELKMIHLHPIIGNNIIQPIDLDKQVKDIVLQHHEQWSGKGYPSGLNRFEINPLAQIVAIADVYDAITSDRPYRQPLTKEKALDILVDMKGKHFNPQYIDNFVELMRGINKEKIDKIIKEQLYERINYEEKSAN